MYYSDFQNYLFGLSDSQLFEIMIWANYLNSDN